MGTGSVEMRFSSAIPRGRRCLSPFSGGDCRDPVEKGDPPFSTRRIQFEMATIRKSCTSS